MNEPLQVIVEDPDDTVKVDPETGTVETRMPDGSVVIHLDAHRKDKEEKDEFYANLALEMDDGKLGSIAERLIQDIEEDDRSRSEYLEIRNKGLDRLGIKLEDPKPSPAGGTVSRVTNPLLLEAVLKGWANARGELLPAEGPVKVKVNEASNAQLDELAETLERSLNYYLTTTATEYYPDTSHMLLWGTYFGGSGFKKVYRCPLRRRPVSESVECQHLIVSDATKDFRSCSRITHQISMRPSVLRRMQLLKVYRDVALGPPSPQPNVVDNKIGTIQGVATQQARRPENQDYTIWESQCELDLDEYAPKHFKGEGLALPYRVTLDKDSRTVLAIHRDWREDDIDCNRRRLYVKYPYVPGPGFYGTGLLNILGNSTMAMTAAWREALDAGMFASYPAFLISRLAGRQDSMNLQAAPGEGIPIQTNGIDIRQMAMPLPYHDVTPGLMQMMDKIEQQSARLGGAVEIATEEGLSNVPVGTMIAQIEQATKVMAAAHRDMHQAQAEEIGMIVDLFRENPGDFRRSNRYMGYWTDEKFEKAIDTYELVPRSDPNTPSHIHRTMKAVAYVQLIQDPIAGQYLDKKEVLRRVVRALRDEPEGIIIDPPPQQGNEAEMAKGAAAMLTAQARMKDADAKAKKGQTDIVLAMMKGKQATEAAAAKAQSDRAQADIEKLRILREQIDSYGTQLKAGHDMALGERKEKLEEMRLLIETMQEDKKMGHEQRLAQQDRALQGQQMAHDQQMATVDRQMQAHQMAGDQQMAREDRMMQREQGMHDRQMAQEDRSLQREQQTHEQRLATRQQRSSERQVERKQTSDERLGERKLQIDATKASQRPKKP